MPDPEALNTFIRDQAAKLRAKDLSPKSRDEWQQRRAVLREKMFAAMGTFPEKPCDLTPRALGTLERDGYRIEKLTFQSRPDVWVTASAYVPSLKDGQKAPAVLAVHGHWPWARRDPVVQARCLGLVKLGFFVLAVDAFGAGERFTKPGKGTYHGALYGSTLWPAGETLVGMQVYDNRRAVDYLLGRPEVNGKLGITGASGGGNQSMYAGALDDRFQAVVPVCSVGNYQSYLRAACCVCEVLPGALTFTEEGDVLGLVAPRALLVISATRDAVQFSPGEAAKSVARARDIFKLHGEESKLTHQVFESPHDYNQAMREAMYGWMTLHLKGEGKGEPIPEPKHEVEKPEDLACFPDPKDRPKGFAFPPSFAAARGRELVARVAKWVPDHPEMWEATALNLRGELKKVLGEMPQVTEPKVDEGPGIVDELIGRGTVTFQGEGGLLISAALLKSARSTWAKSCILLGVGASHEALSKDQFASACVRNRFTVLSADLRGQGDTKPKGGAIAGAPDHNIAEHGVWIGRPLLGQWVTDVRTQLDWIWEKNEGKPVAVAGVGPMGLVALVAGALFPERVSAVAIIGSPVSYITETPYATGTPMGVLAPGILKAGDVPHLAGLVAPRRLLIAGGVSPQGKKLTQKELEEAFAFTRKVYAGTRAAGQLTVIAEPEWDKVEF